MKDFLSMLGTNLKVGWFNFVDYLKTVYHYYSKWSFAKVDLYLLSRYFFKNPFRISRDYLKKKGEKQIYAYGETPLTTFEYIANECQISFMDTVFELGCGRGRTCFWMNSFIGCRVVGVDFVPTFIRIANETYEHFNLTNVKFREENFLKTDLTGATVVYLYGTCLKDDEIHALIDKFKTLHRGVKIITVSFCLRDYDSKCAFEVVKFFPAQFTWGIAEVYLQM